MEKQLQVFLVQNHISFIREDGPARPARNWKFLVIADPVHMYRWEQWAHWLYSGHFNRQKSSILCRGGGNLSDPNVNLSASKGNAISLHSHNSSLCINPNRDMDMGEIQGRITFSFLSPDKLERQSQSEDKPGLKTRE